MGDNWQVSAGTLCFSSFYYKNGVYMGFWRVIITILLPPLGVLIGNGFGWAFLLNILLPLLGYIPGLIHGFWVKTRD